MFWKKTHTQLCRLILSDVWRDNLLCVSLTMTFLAVLALLEHLYEKMILTSKWMCTVCALHTEFCTDHHVLLTRQWHFCRHAAIAMTIVCTYLITRWLDSWSLHAKSLCFIIIFVYTNTTLIGRLHTSTAFDIVDPVLTTQSTKQHRQKTLFLFLFLSLTCPFASVLCTCLVLEWTIFFLL